MHATAQDTNYFSVICPFGGAGGGGFGFQNATRTFRGVKGGFKLLGGFDNWPYAAGVFEYLTGVEEVVLDARQMTGADYVRLYGPTAPRVVFTSPPCVAATKLVTNKKASTPAYVEMNRLLLTNTLTMFEAWPDGPDFVLVENVPNILTKERGADMLQEWCDLMRSRNYAIHVGTHNARHIGNLGQNRERLLIIARHQEKVPVFLYKPPHTPGRTLGDVVGPLPLPDDPAGGPMHGMTRGMSFRNRLRLWKIEAGRDWRSLIHDGLPERARFRRHLVSDPKEPCATIGGPGSNGPCAVADDQAPGRISVELAPTCARFPGSLGVQDPAQPSAAVTGEAAPSNGSNAVADGRVPGLGVALTPVESRARRRQPGPAREQVRHRPVGRRRPHGVRHRHPGGLRRARVRRPAPRRPHAIERPVPSGRRARPLGGDAGERGRVHGHRQRARVDRPLRRRRRAARPHRPAAAGQVLRPRVRRPRRVRGLADGRWGLLGRLRRLRDGRRRAAHRWVAVQLAAEPLPNRGDARPGARHQRLRRVAGGAGGPRARLRAARRLLRRRPLLSALEVRHRLREDRQLHQRGRRSAARAPVRRADVRADRGDRGRLHRRPLRDRGPERS